MFCACFRQRESESKSSLISEIWCENVWESEVFATSEQLQRRSLNDEKFISHQENHPFSVDLSSILSYIHSSLFSTSTPGLSTSEKYIMCCRVRNESWIWMKISVEPLSCGGRPHFSSEWRLSHVSERSVLRQSMSEWEESTNGIIPTAKIYRKGKANHQSSNRKTQEKVFNYLRINVETFSFLVSRILISLHSHPLNLSTFLRRHFPISLLCSLSSHSSFKSRAESSNHFVVDDDAHFLSQLS